VLLNVVMGMSSSASAVYTSHVVGLLVTICTLTVTCVYLLYVARAKATVHGYGPAFLALAAAPWILANPIVNLMFDEHVLPSTHEWNLTLNVGTWLGMCMLSAATLWNANALHKIADRVRGLCPRLVALAFPPRRSAFAGSGRC